MSEPEENTQRVDGAVETGTDEANADETAERGDVELSDLSDTGVGIGAGEPNTFEPEEAAPAAETPTD